MVRTCVCLGKDGTKKKRWRFFNLGNNLMVRLGRNASKLLPRIPR